MTRAHGPYRHGRRWRIIIRSGDGSQIYRSFDTRRAAFAALASGLRMSDEEALSLISAPVAMPSDQLWIYVLVAYDGSALYVGSTRDPNGRRHDHRENGVPFARMDLYPEVLDRAVGQLVEAALIRKLDPPLNRVAKLETDGKLSVSCEQPRSASSSEIADR